jgi:hypothetical protein
VYKVTAACDHTQTHHTQCIRLLLRVGTAVAQWLRYCATNQKVAGSIPDGVMEFFFDTNPSNRTMALGSTQTPTEMSISLGVNAAGA